MKAIVPGAFALLVLSCAILGCGGYNNNTTATTTTTSCNPTSLSVFPQSVTLTHASTGDSQQFGAAVIRPSGCATATPTPTPVPAFTITWSTSDPTDVPISNAHDVTNGTATCVNATHLPVTVIATLPANTATGANAVTGNAAIQCN